MAVTPAQEFHYRQKAFVEATADKLEELNKENRVLIFGCILQSLLGIMSGLYTIDDPQCPIISPSGTKDKTQFQNSWAFLRLRVLQFADVPVHESNRPQFNYVLLLIYDKLFDSIRARIVGTMMTHAPEYL